MSSTTFGYKGLEAYKKKDWANTISFLDKALEDSKSPTWLLARCHAHTQLKNYDAALHDAELAYHCAAERGSGASRKQMIESQYRRAVIYFRLHRFADADCCAKWSMSLAEGRPAGEDDGVEKRVDANGNYTVTVEEGVADKKGQPGNSVLPDQLIEKLNDKTGFEADWNRAYLLRSQALGGLKRLPERDFGRKVHVSKIPIKPQKKVVKKPEPVVEDSDDDEELKKLLDPAPEPVPAPGSVPDEKLKLRADFYQTNQTVTISFFAKDIKKEDLQVEFAEDKVRLGPVPREAARYVKAGDREANSTLLLDNNIIPSASRWSATPRKIELVLQKATPGVKWVKWGEEKIGVGVSDLAPKAAGGAAPVAPAPVTAEPKETTAKDSAAPAYPTSSKSGPKNWEKLDDVDDDEDKQDVNWFFKKLYKDATPEQQRAMMKSFVESNGTALSTDWNDVKGRKVETQPPDGVVAKKWDQ
ncbi:SGS domain-containing protein [Cercophora newfieldiana]|uniref:SGS domain-containing protein n=1 Tax=Cercophora newfieldiana TaxID=92897 RepID=A0AA40CV41_9PEZI|nr:SGS domain-containing protein [Cercophora newfieldiana]